MPQDAFTLKYVTEELDKRLCGGKVSRINQPQNDELTLFIYTAEGTVKLEICAHAQNCRINLTHGGKDAPKAASSFCMLLRKHLNGAKVLSVAQPRFERIAAITFDCRDEFAQAERVLYCEIMGKYSNVILAEGGKILGALKTTSLEAGAKRLLFTGAKYELPEPQDKANPLDLLSLEGAMHNYAGGDRARFLANAVTGISYATACDIEARFCGNACAKDIYDYVAGRYNSPCVTYREGAPDDFKASWFGSEKREFGSVLEAQEAYYAYVSEKKAFEDRKRRLAGALKSAEKKCEKRLAQIIMREQECLGIEDVKLAGELITANIYAIERGAKEFKAVNYYDENMPEVTISLDPRLTPAQNAQKYYKKYAKLKRTVTALAAQRGDAEAENSYLASIRHAIDSAEEIADFDGIEAELEAAGILKAAQTERGKKKKEERRAPYRRYEYGGFTILAGRNNVQNERLTRSLAEGDIWLHAQKYHSSHAAILTDGRKVPDGVIKIAAEICAYYSEGRDSGKVPVDYTYKKYVKKPSGAKTGFAVYTDYKTAVAQPHAHAELRRDEEQI